MSDWYVRGSYYESCVCEAICPCRPQGERPGGRSTYGYCDFVLSWWIEDGRVDGVDLAGRRVVVAGGYDDDEPGTPWRLNLYLDDEGSFEQHEALVDLYEHRLPFSEKITEVKTVRSATIELDHTPDAQRIEVAPYITVRTRESVPHAERVSCGVPGHEHPGQEIIADVMRVDDPEFSWEVRGRCGFAAKFTYRG